MKEILITTPTGVLQEWLYGAAKEFVKEQKIEELETKKKKKFLYFFGKDEEITENEI